jgi:hypothetical protein
MNGVRRRQKQYGTKMSKRSIETIGWGDWADRIAGVYCLASLALRAARAKVLIVAFYVADFSRLDSRRTDTGQLLLFVGDIADSSLTMLRGSLSVRNPAKLACIKCPSGVHSVNSI